MALEKIDWLSIERSPDNYSFRCLIKFKETGLNGHLITTGYWSAVSNAFVLDNREYVKLGDLTPIGFMFLHEHDERILE